MSNALAIAAVTAVLADLLNNGIIDQKASASVGAPVTISTLPPDRIETGEKETACLNLFLYHIAHNPGWRNVGLPSHNQASDRVDNPPLPLDLYYLLTAYGKNGLDAEILMGYGMQLLHETPILTRNAIRKSLGPPSPAVDGSILPGVKSELAAAELAEQVELIKITPHAMSSEEIIKLWTAIQTKYRTSAVYHVSVVLIESTLSIKSSLPVHGRKIYVMPFKQPVIDQVLSQAKEDDPARSNQQILSGHRLILMGNQLRGDRTSVKIDGGEIDAANVFDIEDSRIAFLLPGNLRAGIHSLQIAHKMMMGDPAQEHSGSESRVTSFVLSPTITAVEKSAVTSEIVDTVTLYSLDITLTIAPLVGKKQRVLLCLNEYQKISVPAKAYSVKAPMDNGISQPAQETTDSIKFAVTKVVAGTYFVRIQIDGAESPLDFTEGSATFGPTVTIP